MNEAINDIIKAIGNQKITRKLLIDVIKAAYLKGIADEFEAGKYNETCGESSVINITMGYLQDKHDYTAEKILEYSTYVHDKLEEYETR